MAPKIETVRDQVAWSYANLARAHAALNDGSSKYSRKHHIIRNRLFHGLRSGRMSMRSLYDDERLKMMLPNACAYCGSTRTLSIDHLVPRIKSGTDDGANLVHACRPCNSSKHGRDLLVWMESKERFPSIFVLRRYLKLVALRCDELGIWDEPLEMALLRDLPFSLDLLPTGFPSLDELRLRVEKAPLLNANKDIAEPISPS